MKTGDRVAAYTQQNEGAPLTPQQLRRVKQKAWRDQDEHNVVGRIGRLRRRTETKSTRQTKQRVRELVALIRARRGY
jgi:hypothetical protein